VKDNKKGDRKKMIEFYNSILCEERRGEKERKERVAMLCMLRRTKERTDFSSRLFCQLSVFNKTLKEKERKRERKNQGKLSDLSPPPSPLCDQLTNKFL